MLLTRDGYFVLNISVIQGKEQASDSFWTEVSVCASENGEGEVAFYTSYNKLSGVDDTYSMFY